MGHQEVIRFACGIKESILEFVFTTLLSTFVCFQKDDKEFFGMLCGEANAENKIDPVHNRYICLIDNDFDLSKFEPSRLYLFENFGTNAASWFQSPMPGVCNSSAECTIEALNNKKMWETLTVFREMTRFQQITVRYLKLRFIDTTSKGTNSSGDVINEIKISKNIRYVEISHCKLSSPLYNYIADQLCECEKLKELNLSETRNIPTKLGRAIASIKFLEVVNLYDCHMTPGISRAILNGLSHCGRLKVIRLDNNQLTNCLGHIFTNYTEFSNLKDLNISNAEITRSDFKNLLTSLRDRKCPKLANFSLSDRKVHASFQFYNKNRLYPDSLALLLDVVDYPESKAFFDGLGLSEYEHLESDILVERYLCNSYLSRGDVQAVLTAAEKGKLVKLRVLNFGGCDKDSWLSFLNKTIIGREEVLGLSEIVTAHKLPQLRSLILSHNKLTDLIEVLMRASYPQLGALTITDAKLSKLDVSSLADAVTANHLPNLEYLNLSHNKLTDLMEVLMRASYPKLDWLDISYARLSKTDVTSLGNAVISNHLPKLDHLNLLGNKPGGADIGWQNLVASLLSVYSENRLTLFLRHSDMSLATCDTLESLCQETNIELYICL